MRKKRDLELLPILCDTMARQKTEILPCGMQDKVLEEDRKR